LVFSTAKQSATPEARSRRDLLAPRVHPPSEQLGMAEAAGGARSEAAEANAAGESAALAAAPDTAGGGGKRRRCEDTAEGAARKKARSICPHGRERSQCTECGGAGICPHQRQRSRCKECGGAGICPHQRQRSRCKECREEADESMPDGLEEL